MTYTVSVIQESGSGKEKRTFFKPCGIGFANRDGSINIRLDLFPTVTLHVREKTNDTAAQDRS